MKILLILTCLFFMTSCSSINVRSGGLILNDAAKYPSIYPGVREDYLWLTTSSPKHPHIIDLSLIIKPLAAIDFPFSFALDTILFPIDLSMKIAKNKSLDKQCGKVHKR
ncbi:YceK/YidQ family lipoprotein [Thiotrichales bacterium HSG1]|nr:YceK/YidQ family lipoprotein [Thiotrichales bacterium HSG1]